ncbi:MAG: hypothetical protein DME26_09610 [Verrucomicrobia bacterium]|nr:MAG: hypothetical protein DME26_09610 [Verrucomicrobiota bacterium]
MTTRNQNDQDWLEHRLLSLFSALSFLEFLWAYEKSLLQYGFVCSWPVAPQQFSASLCCRFGNIDGEIYDID